MKELREVRGMIGLPLELDPLFEPKKLGELLEFHQQQRSKPTDDGGYSSTV